MPDVVIAVCRLVWTICVGCFGYETHYDGTLYFIYSIYLFGLVLRGRQGTNVYVDVWDRVFFLCNLYGMVDVFCTLALEKMFVL